MPERFETTWPDKSFAQFGGHVLERLFVLHNELANAVGDFRLSALGETPARHKQFTVRVTVEVQPIADPDA
jgi:hypothetical protein